MVGIMDLNVSSNSDVGMSGSFVPYAKLYDRYYFTPEHEPCQGRYLFDKSLHDEHGFDIGVDTVDFDTYIYQLEEANQYREPLQYEKIEIVEKETEDPKKATK